MKKILIKTRFAEGIAAVGGTTVSYYTWNIGPINLHRAIKMLPTHSREMELAYGNHGHAGSWIEVAGVRMSQSDISDFWFSTDHTNFTDSPLSAISKTEWCSQFIASVLDGSLIENRRQFAEYDKLEAAAYEAGLAAGREGKPMPEGFSGHEYELERGHTDGCQERREMAIGE